MSLEPFRGLFRLVLLLLLLLDGRSLRLLGSLVREQFWFFRFFLWMVLRCLRGLRLIVELLCFVRVLGWIFSLFFLVLSLLGRSLFRIFFSFGMGVLCRLMVSFCGVFHAILTMFVLLYESGDTIEVWNINFWKSIVDGYVRVAIVLN